MKMATKKYWVDVLAVILVVNHVANAFPEQGRWESVINDTSPYFGVYKSLFKGSKIFVTIQCASLDQMDVNINWELRETPCWEEYWKLDLLTDAERQQGWMFYYNLFDKVQEGENPDHLYYSPPKEYTHRCDNSISLNEFAENCSSPISTKKLPESLPSPASLGTTLQPPPAELSLCQNPSSSSNSVNGRTPVVTVAKDGVYLFILRMEPVGGRGSFSANVGVHMKGDHGYLSATEYPLLLFYGACCVIYTMYGVAWLILSFWHWQDLLRIQFWIGAVILLGMIEMAVFYAEYQSINASGSSVTGAVIIAEIISCAKRTLARMLVVIVSIGFGIVKPRLGSTLHRIIVVGSLYFGLASVESILRILHPVNGPSNRAIMAGVPLSVLDASIFYWIFQSLMTTMRTLRLRRNLIKLNLYRHFTNTLIFSVIASVAFMIWSIRFLKTTQCLKDWKEIWIDEAYWHVLFAIILLVIMILWRPSNNNQRYAFSPLIDNEDDEEEEDLVVNEAFSHGNMKLRQKNGNEKQYGRSQSMEDELRWVEQNIPADLGEGDLPALDSEEELISTKFELSKMQ